MSRYNTLCCFCRMCCPLFFTLYKPSYRIHQGILFQLSASFVGLLMLQLRNIVKVLLSMFYDILLFFFGIFRRFF